MHLWNFSDGDIFNMECPQTPLDLIEHMVNGFLKENSKSMNAADPLNECLKELVLYSKGLRGDRFKLRKRKKRISMVCDKYVKFLSRQDYPKRELSDFKCFCETVKKVFLIELTKVLI